MPDFKVRTYEDIREISADRMEFDEQSVRFHSGDRVIAVFSRFLWAEEVIVATEVPAIESEPAASAVPEATE